MRDLNSVLIEGVLDAKKSLWSDSKESAIFKLHLRDQDEYLNCVVVDKPAVRSLSSMGNRVGQVRCVGVLEVSDEQVRLNVQHLEVRVLTEEKAAPKIEQAPDVREVRYTPGSDVVEADHIVSRDDGRSGLYIKHDGETYKVAKVFDDNGIISSYRVNKLGLENRSLWSLFDAVCGIEDDGRDHI